MKTFRNPFFLEPGIVGQVDVAEVLYMKLWAAALLGVPDPLILDLPTC